MVPPPRGCGWQTTAAATAEVVARRIPSSDPCATGIVTRPDGDSGADIAATVSLRLTRNDNDGHTGLGRPLAAAAPNAAVVPSSPTSPSPVCPKHQAVLLPTPVITTAVPAASPAERRFFPVKQRGGLGTPFAAGNDGSSG